MARIIQTADLTPKTKLTFNDQEWVYNGLDVCVTLEVLEILLPQLDNQSSTTYDFSKALQAPILEMGMRGLRVDQWRRNKVLREYNEQLDRLEANLTRIVREGIGFPVESNSKTRWWRSPAQLKTLFYEVMGLSPIRKRNANGVMAPTVNRDAIERLSLYLNAEMICSHLLLMRDIEKKRQFLETEFDADGRIRTSFNIAGTNTGRLASSMAEFGTGTNLQNVDRLLRSVFIADPGMKFGNVDLEQGDSRNLGALCWERFYEREGPEFAGAYLDACESGDLHTTVSRMARPTLAWSDDPVANRKLADTKYYRNDSYRDLDKKLGHGSNYLGQPRTMAKHSKVPQHEVEIFQHNYFRAFPCIPAYHEWVWHELLETSSLTTLFGRRRYFFGRIPYASDSKWQSSDTIREAVAFGPQSMTAEEINIGMLNVWRGNRVQLLVQVHDSILFQYREEEEDEIIPWVISQLRVPLRLAGDRDFYVPAEAKVGWNWGDWSEDNIDGLKKWKGGDDRKRSEQPKAFL